MTVVDGLEEELGSVTIDVRRCGVDVYIRHVYHTYDIHVYVHECVSYIYACTRTHTHTHAHTRVSMHTHSYALTHAYVYARTNAPTRTHAHA